jgi:hypothetical protein
VLPYKQLAKRASHVKALKMPHQRQAVAAAR